MDYSLDQGLLRIHEEVIGIVISPRIISIVCMLFNPTLVIQSKHLIIKTMV